MNRDNPGVDSRGHIRTVISFLLQPVRTFKNHIDLEPEKTVTSPSKTVGVERTAPEGPSHKIFSTLSAKLTPPPPSRLPVSQEIRIFREMLYSWPFVVWNAFRKSHK